MDESTAMDLVLCELVRQKELSPWMRDLYKNSMLSKVSKAVQLAYKHFFGPSAYASVVLEGSVAHSTATASSDADFVVRDQSKLALVVPPYVLWFLL